MCLVTFHLLGKISVCTIFFFLPRPKGIFFFLLVFVYLFVCQSMRVMTQKVWRNLIKKTASGIVGHGTAVKRQGPKKTRTDFGGYYDSGCGSDELLRFCEYCAAGQFSIFSIIAWLTISQWTPATSRNEQEFGLRNLTSTLKDKAAIWYPAAEVGMKLVQPKQNLK